jgi:hypothetical protein
LPEIAMDLQAGALSVCPSSPIKQVQTKAEIDAICFALSRPGETRSRPQGFLASTARCFIKKCREFGQAPGECDRHRFLEKGSIEYAREVAASEHLNIIYVTQNYLEFETEERIDLVLLIM